MKKLYIAYLDEFGHVGPYVSRTDQRFHESPVFGFGGMILPADEVRSFATWFYQLKNNLLTYEVDQASKAGIPLFRMEKKGAALYTTPNILKYPELRRATFRLFNKVKDSEGKVFYVGIEKKAPPQEHHSQAMLLSILRHAVRRLDQFCTEQDAEFLLFLDARDDKQLREAVVSVVQQEMYGPNPCRTLLEAPTQVESHMYQTMQCADWLCGLIGRMGCYWARPSEYPELIWTKRYFTTRLHSIASNSGIRIDQYEESLY
jgi:Protein of unknown function (DUF3800)